MSELSLLSNLSIIGFIVSIFSMLMWIIYLSLRHVKNSVVLGSSDVNTDEYDVLEDLVLASESDHHQH